LRVLAYFLASMEAGVLSLAPEFTVIAAVPDWLHVPPVVNPIPRVWLLWITCVTVAGARDMVSASTWYSRGCFSVASLTIVQPGLRGWVVTAKDWAFSGIKPGISVRTAAAVEGVAVVRLARSKVARWIAFPPVTALDIGKFHVANLPLPANRTS
jgi:hypothetical protein